MSERMCPVCGIGTLAKVPRTIMVTDPSGIEKPLDVFEYKCPSCDAEGDLFGDNEHTIQKKYVEIRADAVASMLEKFSGNSIRYSAAERVLGLPQRTLSKWKNKSVIPSAGATVLMRYLDLFPWLLDVADNKFEKKGAMRIHIASSNAGSMRHDESERCEERFCRDRCEPHQLKLDTLLICDAIRQEVGGKQSLMGLYNDAIIFSPAPEGSPVWPKLMRLVFLSVCHSMKMIKYRKELHSHSHLGEAMSLLRSRRGLLLSTGHHIPTSRRGQTPFFNFCPRAILSLFFP